MQLQALSFIEEHREAVNGVSGLSGASGVAVSPDGAHLYATGFNYNGLAIFQRNLSSGRLSFISSLKQGVDGVTGLSGANDVLLSPDGQHVYVAGFFSNAVAVFRRDTGSGALTQVETKINGQGGVSGLLGAAALAMDAQGKHLYVAGMSDNAIAVFSRNSSTGGLSFVEMQQGVSGLNRVSSVLLSPDGASLYATGSQDNAVVQFSREATTGRLSFINSYQNGLNGVSQLGGAYHMVLDANAERLFVAANTDNSIVVFNRNTASGNLSFVQAYINNADGISGLDGVRALATSGSRLYAVGSNANALAEFTVLAGGGDENLSFSTVLENGIGGVSGLDGPTDVTLAAGGLHVYTSANTSHTLAMFGSEATDLSLSVQAPTQAQIGLAFDYRFTLSNLGPVQAQSVSLTAQLDANLSYVMATAPTGVSCNEIDGLVTCMLGDLAVAANAEITIQVTAAEAGAVTTNAQVSSAQLDPNAADNQTASTTTVLTELPEADLGVTLSAHADPVNLSSPLIYTLTVTNGGPQTASDVVLTQTMPPNSSFLSARAEQGSCEYRTLSLSCQLGSLAVGAQTQVEVTLLSPATGSIVSTDAQVSSSLGDSQTDNDSAMLNVQASELSTDLVLASLTASADSVQVGQELSYTAIVANRSTVPTSYVVVEDLFSSATGMEFVSSSTTSPGAPNPGAPCSESPKGELTCLLGTLNEFGNGSTVSLNVVVRALEGGTLSSLAKVSANATDTQPADNQRVIETAVNGDAADIAVEVSSQPATQAAIGESINYDIVVANNSAGASENVTLTARLPSQVTYQTVSSTQGSCTYSLSVVSCPLGTLDGGAGATVTVTVKAASQGNANLSAEIAANTFDPSEADNSASHTLSIGLASADLSVTASASPDPVIVSDTLTYQVSVSNAGPNPATQVTLSSTLPAGVSLLSATPAQGECNLSGQAWNCALGELSAAQTVLIELRVMSTLAGVLTNTLSVLSSVGDPDDTDNHFSLESRVNEPQSLIFSGSYKDGVEALDGLQGAHGVTSSADGAYIYVAGFYDDAIAVFQRDTVTDVLTLLQVVRNGVAGTENLKRPTEVVLSDDENYLYVASFGVAALVVFQRDPDSGQLTYLQTVQQARDGIDNLIGIFSVKTRGAYVYTAAFNDDAISVFQADPSTGLLTRQAVLKEGENGVAGLDGVSEIHISPDGARLYAASVNSNALAVFNRSLTDGSLSFAQSFTNGGLISGLTQANGVTVSPDNQYIYVAGNADNSIAIFHLSQEGAMNFVGSFRDDTNLLGVTALEMSPEGGYLYAAATTASRLVVFSRNPVDGGLNLINAVLDGQDGAGLSGIRDINITAAGDAILVASLDASTLSLFRLPMADLKLTLTTDKTQANLGDSLSFTATLLNQGPDAATANTVLVNFPEGIEVTAVNPSRGSCTQPTAQTLNCSLGSLNAQTTATLVISARAAGQGDFMVAASASASQPDPVQPNSAEVALKIIGVADLNVTQTTLSETVPVGGQVEFITSVVNTGPNDATDLILTYTLPLNAALVSASSEQGSCEPAAGSLLSCHIASLASQAEAQLSLILQAQEIGVMTNRVQVTATQADPTLPNTDSKSVEIVSNIIDSEYDNTGKVLSNFIIASSGTVTGGSLDGTITNQGLLQDLTILSDTSVSGGGRIGGSIINQGTIENAILLSGAQISGGLLRGNIGGSSESPALLNGVTIADGAQLSYVIIGAGSTLGSGVTLGAGVRFVDNSAVPAGLDLSAALSMLQEPITLAQAINLQTDIISGGIALLDAINALPVMRNNGWTMYQYSHGHVIVPVDVLGISAIPWQVRQAESGFTPGLELFADQSALITTAQGREIYFRPAAQSPTGLLAALQLFGLNEVTADSNGHLHVPGIGASYVARPHIQTDPVGADKIPGSIEFIPTGLLDNTVYAQAFFMDALGQSRQQLLYPAAAHQEQLRLHLENDLAATQIEFRPEGILRAKLTNEYLEGVFDYSVLAGDGTGTSVQLLPVTDVNADGVSDYQIRYPGGERQYLFVIPPPDIVEEIAQLPELVAAGYQVLRVSDDSMLMAQTGSGEARLLLLGIADYAPEGTAAGVSYHLDGSMTFVTLTERRVTGQPLFQDLSELNSVLQYMGVTAPVQENRLNGYLRLPIDSNLYFSAQPEQSSVLSSKALGLHAVEDADGNISYALVFQDDLGMNREQQVFPASPYEAELNGYLLNRSGIDSVTFYADGRVVAEGSQPIYGWLDYLVNTDVIPADGLQFTSLPDTNGDGLSDYAILYPAGGMQILYRMSSATSF